MRTIIGREGFDREAASGSRMARFETEWPESDAGLAALSGSRGAPVDRACDRKPADGAIFDMDGSVGPTFGERPW